MPIYLFMCPNGTKFDRYLPVARYKETQVCECCDQPASKIITLPMILVKPDICYDSPIDGRHITSMAARREDLARSNCVPYDPDIKQHVEEKRKREEAELDKAVDETIDREIALMPARKREKLEAELHGGLTVEPTRLTPAAKPIVKEVVNV